MDFRPSQYNNRNAIKPSYKYKNKRVIWLNSAFADDIYNYNEYLFYVRPFQIYNYSILKPICYINETEGNSLNILKIKDLKYNSDYIWDTDRKDGATILTAHTKVESQEINRDYILTLEPQQVDKITIINNEILEETTNYNSFTINRRYPPKAYNSISTIVDGKLGNIDCKTNSITLTTADITYGSGTYQIFQSTAYGTSGNTEANRLFNYTTPTSDPEYNCGNGNYNTSGNYINSRYLVSNYLGEWIVIKMVNAIVMTSYEFYQRTSFPIRSPKNFRVYGSNDGFNWVQLQNITNATYAATYIFTSPYINNKTPYLYYGVVVNALMGADQILNFNEWVINGYEITNFEYTIPDNWFEANLSDPYYNTGTDKTLTPTLTNLGVSTTNGYNTEFGWNFTGATPHLYDSTYKSMANQSFSFCCWSKRTANNNDDWILSVGGGTTSGSAMVMGYTNTNILRITNLTTAVSTTKTYLDAGKWVHLAFTYETGSKIAKIYYNGELVAEGVSGEITPNSFFVIGKFSTNYYGGILSDIKFFYKSLSPPQISYLYNEKPQRQFPPKTWDSTDLGAVEKVSYFNGVRCYETSFEINSASYGNGIYKCWYSSAAYTDTTQNRSPTYLFNKNINNSLNNPNFYFNNYDLATGEIKPNEPFDELRGVPLIDKSYLGEWVIIKLPEKIILKSYNFVPTPIATARSPMDYRIYGSNDGINWELLIEEKAVPATEYTTNSNYFKTIPTNNKEFIYYSLVVNKLQINGGSLSFQEWILRGEELQNKFILGLEIEEQDLIPDNIVSEYK